jgi:hypothetical protein
MICGPPGYLCARTDMTVAQLPSMIPNMNNLTGAGTVIIDAAFGSRVARITDSTLDSTLTGGTYVIDPGGSGDRNEWNTDSTLLHVSSTGTRGYILNFVPSTMQASNRYPGSFIGNLKGTFSFSNKFLFFGVAPNSTAVSQWDFTTSGTIPTATAVSSGAIDFTATNCLGAGYTPTTVDTLSTSKIPADTIFATSFSNTGGQNTGVNVVAYKVGSGYSCLNTQTGVVTGDWGATGTVGPVTDRFPIHEIRLSQNGRYMLLAKGGCFNTCGIVPYVWEIGTLNLTLVCTVKCGGHFATGFNTWVNNNGSPLFQWESRLLTTPGTSTDLIASFPSPELTPVDHHAGWANANAADTNYVFMTQTDTGSFLGNYPSAWYAEVNGIDPTGATGLVKRFAHTYTTGESLIFDTQQAIGSISQDGRFYGWSSDWMGSLGKSDGMTGACIGGGADWKASTAYSTTTTAACAATSVSNTSCILPDTNNVGINSVGYVFAATTGGISGGSVPKLQLTGTVNTSAIAVTWVSGDQFTNANPADPIFINNVRFTIATVNSPTSITLTASAGSQTGVSYSVGASTATDGTITWANVGQPNCRGDVFVVELR